MDDDKQFAERYLNNDLSYNEYIDFLYDIELEKDKENQKKVLNPSYIIKENKDTSLFSETLSNYFAEQRGISVPPFVIEGKAPEYDYERNRIVYKGMNLDNRTEYPLLLSDFIHETEHCYQNPILIKFEERYKKTKLSFLSPKLKEMTDGLKIELALVLDTHFINKYGLGSDERGALTYSNFHEVEARLKEKDVINKSLSIILNDKNTLNQKLMLLQQYRENIESINRFFLDDALSETLDLIKEECSSDTIEQLNNGTFFKLYNVKKDLITSESLEQLLTEGALKVNKMVEETLRQIDVEIDKVTKEQSLYQTLHKTYAESISNIVSLNPFDNITEIRNSVSYLCNNYTPEFFENAKVDISSLTFKLSEMYRQFDTDRREDALSIKKDTREFFVKLIKSQHLSFFIDNKVNDFVYGEFITKELNHLPISDIEKENIRNRVFRIKTAKNFISNEQKTTEDMKRKVEKLQQKQYKNISVSSMPIGDAVLNDEEVVIKEETDVENRKIRNIKNVEEWEER